jgi:hypothetical protein
LAGGYSPSYCLEWRLPSFSDVERRCVDVGDRLLRIASREGWEEEEVLGVELLAVAHSVSQFWAMQQFAQDLTTDHTYQRRGGRRMTSESIRGRQFGA